MFKQPIGVIFDLDDTLYLERDYVTSGFRAVGEWCYTKFGLTGFEQVAWRLFECGIRGKIFDQALKELGLNGESEFVETMVQIYREHQPNIVLLPDAEECLRFLRDRVYLGLITDGVSVSQWRKICALGLAQRFDSIIVTGDWGAQFYKPHHRAFTHFQNTFPACAGHFVYIADNPHKDFNAPNQLAWRALRVRRPSSLHYGADCAEITAVQEIADLREVPQRITEFFDFVH